MMVEEPGETAAENCRTKRNAADTRQSLVHTTSSPSPVFQQAPPSEPPSSQASQAPPSEPPSHSQVSKEPPSHSQVSQEPPSQSSVLPEPPVPAKKSLEEALLQENSGAVAVATTSDLITIGQQKAVSRSRKKSEEGRSAARGQQSHQGRGQQSPQGQGHQIPQGDVGGSKKSGEGQGKNRKQRTIPVGIAVAWQRHVTSSGTSSHTNTNTMSYASKKHLNPSTDSTSSGPTCPTMSSPPPKRKRSPSSPKVSLAVTGPGGSASTQVRNGHEGPHCHKLRVTEGHHQDLKCGGALKSPSPLRVPVATGGGALKKLSVGDSSDLNGKLESSEHVHAFGSDIGGVSGSGVTSHGDKLRSPHGQLSTKSSNSFYSGSPYGYSNPYGDWTSQYFVPNSSQQSYNAMMAAYIQQLAMHNSAPTPTVPYGYNSLSSPYLYPGSGDSSAAYTPEQLHQYDRLLLQRQQEQFERSQVEQQRRLLSDFDLRHGSVSTPIPNLSPRISIPSPSPNSPQGPFGGAGGPFPAHQASTTPTVPWMTSDLYHHHHPMTLISSATLSPRSLASSTPSPITTYESLNHSYLYNRKCITPIPPLKQPFPGHGGLFSPPLYPKDAGPVSLVTHSRTASPDRGRQCSGGGELNMEGAAEESVEIPVVAEGKESIVVKPEKTVAVDFTRLESLIEKRVEDGQTVNVVAHAPLKREEQHEQNKRRADQGQRSSRKHRHQQHQHRDCNGNEMKVPENERESEATAKIKNEQAEMKEEKERKQKSEKYFLPISKVVDEMNIYSCEDEVERRDEDSVRTDLEHDDEMLSTSLDPRHDSSSTPMAIGSNPVQIPGFIITDNIRIKKQTWTKSVNGLPCDTGSSPPRLVAPTPDNVGASWPHVSSVGAGGGHFSSNSSNVNVVSTTTSSPPTTFPKIVIPSGESHLNLLATVAQEIGPYISLLPANQSTSPRRFDGVDLDQLITIESWHEEVDTSAELKETKDGDHIEPRVAENREILNFTESIKDEDEIIVREEDVGEQIVPKIHTEESLVQNQPIFSSNPEPFQLKIPQIVSRLEKVKMKKEKLEKRTTGSEGREKTKNKRESKSSESIQKSSLPELKVKPKKIKIEKEKVKTKTDEVKPKTDKVKIKTEKVKIKTEKVKIRSDKVKTQTEKKSDVVSPVIPGLDVSSSSENRPKLTCFSLFDTPRSKPTIQSQKVTNSGSSSEVKNLESIYDFEAEDVLPPELKTFKHFTSLEAASEGKETKQRKNKQFSMLSHLYASTKKSYAGSHLAPAATTSKPKDLKDRNKNKSPDSKKRSRGQVVTKGHDPPSISPRASKKVKMLRTCDSFNGTTTIQAKEENSTKEEGNLKKEEGNSKKSKVSLSDEVKEKSGKVVNSSTASRPTAIETFLSASINTDSNGTDLSTDSGSSTTWTANPTLAVTAIKLPPLPGDKVKVTKSKVKSPKMGSSLTLTKSEQVTSTYEGQEHKKMAGKQFREHKKLKVSPSTDSDGTSNPIWKKSVFPVSPARKKRSGSPHHIKPCLKAEPIRTRTVVDDDHDQAIDDELFLNLNGSSVDEKFEVEKSEKQEKAPKLKIRKPSIDMNIFSRKVKCLEEEKVIEEEAHGNDWPERVVIGGPEEMIDEMRVLTEIEGLFYTGKLNALQPPDVYGVTLDNERGAPPHIIFSAEEVLEKCIREAKPWKPSQLPHGLRICAYWSAMYSGLYPGHVSTDYDLTSDLVPVQFDDGDTGVIKICEIRLLAPDHPVREYDPNPLLTLEKKHRKRRHSSAGGAGGVGECSGEHEEDDCGEAICAKIAKLQEAEVEEEDFSSPPSNRFKYWTWTGLGMKQGKTKQNRHKEFFQGIQRGEEVINVGDSAIFISEQQNRRPFLGKIENFWEKKGVKSVTVRWFYHPEEAKTNRKMPTLQYPGAVFESPHTDDNDVQTIAKKCEVLTFKDFKAKYGSLFSSTGGKTGKPTKAAAAALRGVYYIAGHYDPYARSLKMASLK